MKRSPPRSSRYRAISSFTDALSPAREILEGSLGGAVLQSPRCIGVVYVLQRPATFLVHRGMAFTDIAFSGDWKLHRGPAVFLERRTIGLHQRRHFAEAA